MVCASYEIFKLTFVHALLCDLDDLPGINRLSPHNDLKFLDLQAMPGLLSRPTDYAQISNTSRQISSQNGPDRGQSDSLWSPEYRGSPELSAISYVVNFYRYHTGKEAVSVFYCQFMFGHNHIKILTLYYFFFII